MRLWMTKRRRVGAYLQLFVGGRCTSRRTSRHRLAGTFQTRSQRCGNHRGISHFSSYQQVVDGVSLLSVGASLDRSVLFVVV